MAPYARTSTIVSLALAPLASAEPDSAAFALAHIASHVAASHTGLKAVSNLSAAPAFVCAQAHVPSLSIVFAPAVLFTYPWPRSRSPRLVLGAFELREVSSLVRGGPTRPSHSSRCTY